MVQSYNCEIECRALEMFYLSEGTLPSFVILTLPPTVVAKLPTPESLTHLCCVLGKFSFCMV